MRNATVCLDSALKVTHLGLQSRAARWQEVTPAPPQPPPFRLPPFASGRLLRSRPFPFRRRDQHVHPPTYARLAPTGRSWCWCGGGESDLSLKIFLLVVRNVLPVISRSSRRGRGGGATGGAKSRSSERRDLSVTDSKNRAIPGAAKCFRMRIIEEAAWTRLGLLWISRLYFCFLQSPAGETLQLRLMKNFSETSSPASFTARQSRLAWNHITSLLYSQ